MIHNTQDAMRCGHTDMRIDTAHITRAGKAIRIRNQGYPVRNFGLSNPKGRGPDLRARLFRIHLSGVWLYITGSNIDIFGNLIEILETFWFVLEIRKPGFLVWAFLFGYTVVWRVPGISGT